MTDLEKVQAFVRKIKVKYSKKPIEEIMAQGMKAYEDSVREMSDEDLYKYICSEPQNKDSFCIQEFDRRGLKA